MAGPEFKDARGATPFNPAGVSDKDRPGPSGSPQSYGIGVRGMPNAESFGKTWGGNVGPKATSGQGESKPGKTARDTGSWGGNVGGKVTTGKPRVGAKSP